MGLALVDFLEAAPILADLCVEEDQHWGDLQKAKASCINQVRLLKLAEGVHSNVEFQIKKDGWVCFYAIHGAGEGTKRDLAYITGGGRINV